MKEFKDVIVLLLGMLLGALVVGIVVANANYSHSACHREHVAPVLAHAAISSSPCREAIREMVGVPHGEEGFERIRRICNAEAEATHALMERLAPSLPPDASASN